MSFTITNTYLNIHLVLPVIGLIYFISETKKKERRLIKNMCLM